MRQYAHDLSEAWEFVRAEVEDGVVSGEVAVLVGRIHFRGKESGVEMDPPAGWMLQFRDGKVLAFRAFRDPHEALARVGSPCRPAP